MLGNPYMLGTPTLTEQWFNNDDEVPVPQPRLDERVPAAAGASALAGEATAIDTGPRFPDSRLQRWGTMGTMVQ